MISVNRVVQQYWKNTQFGTYSIFLLHSNQHTGQEIMAHAIVIVQMIWCPWNEAELCNWYVWEQWDTQGGTGLNLVLSLPLQHKPKTTMTGLGTRLAENDEKVTGSGTGMRTEVVQSWSGNETHTRKLRYSFHRSVLRHWCASARR